jgi:Tol biopolymer transport system component
VRERARGLGAALVVAAGLGAGVVAGGGTAEADPALARIAFSSGGRIFTIDADGSNRVQLTGGPRPRSEGGDYYPVFSPDRARLAFVRVFNDGDSDVGARIYLMDADGSNQEPLTGGRREVYEFNPQWAPGGQSLAFARIGHGSSAIFAIRSDGSHRYAVVKRRFAADPFAFLGEPAWDPDGALLAYTRTTFGESFYRPSLHIVDRSGTNKQRLARNASAAAWSPDGTRIAFASTRDENGTECDSDFCSYRTELYVMDADGTSRTRLTRNKGYDYSPDWSADGQHLVFASDRNFPSGSNSAEIYSIEPDGSCLTWLTNGSPASFTPDWQPDPLAGTAPSGCGAVSRRPLVEARGRKAGRVRHFKPLWLGKRYRSMILADVFAHPRGGAAFAYDDCGRFDPRDCGPSVFLSERWVCSGGLLGFPQLRVRKRRGALVSFAKRRGLLTVNSGAAQIDIDLDGPRQRGLHQAMGVVEALRHLGESSPGGRLARAQLPRRLLRELRRIESAYERLGSIKAVHQELGISSLRVRNGLRFADALRRLGRVKAVGCPHRPHRRRRGLPSPHPLATGAAAAPAVRKILGVGPRVSRRGR